MGKRGLGSTGTGARKPTDSDLKTKGLEMNIQPNPSRGDVAFAIETMKETELTITVTDMTGKVVKVFEHVKTADKAASISWETGFLSKGTYLVKVTTTDRQSVTRKLIVE